jgi:hypothetical protein
MKTSDYVKLLDGILFPSGFSRKKHTWNLSGDGYVDVVSLQISKGKEALTINLGVYQPDIYAECWPGATAPEFIDEASCIVRARLGELINGRDHWWRSEDHSGAAIVAREIERRALAFLHRMHSLRAMELFLEQGGASGYSYPLPAIYLAIILIRQQRVSEGCELLRLTRERTTSAWRGRIDDIIGKHCQSSTNSANAL